MLILCRETSRECTLPVSRFPFPASHFLPPPDRTAIMRRLHAAALVVAAAVAVPAIKLSAQARDTTRQARDSLRRDAARRPSVRGDTTTRSDTARAGAPGARDTTPARSDSGPPSPYNGLRLRSIGP